MSETEPIRGRPRRAADRVLIAAFLTAICLPAADTFLRLDPTPPGVESAPPAEPPRLGRPVSPRAIRRFLGASRGYLVANFGFRRVLLRACNLAELRLFGRFSAPVVLSGRDGTMVQDHFSDLGSPPRFREEDLEKWRAALVWRRDWCRERKIPYLLVFAPAQQTIYPETLPSYLTDPATPSRLDQLIAHLSEKTDLEILDLRRPLKEARSLGRLYYRTDTHWNERGAYVGYREIMGRLARWLPGLEAAPLESFEIREEVGPGGNMAGILGLRDVFRDAYVRFDSRTPPLWTSTGGGPAARRSIIVGKIPLVTAGVASSTMPRAFMVRDSFASAMIPFLAQHFSRIDFFWRAFDSSHRRFPADLIEREHPDVVIDEFFEPTITIEAPPNAAPRGGEAESGPAPD